MQGNFWRDIPLWGWRNSARNPIANCNCDDCFNIRDRETVDGYISEYARSTRLPILVTEDGIEHGPSIVPPVSLTSMDDGNPKDKLGDAKPQMGLIPVGAMEDIARVMELGAKKYGAYNWRSKAVRMMVYAHAALRHLFAWIGGEDLDPESGRSHLAHLAACALIILDATKVGKAIDDRSWVKKDGAGQ